MMQAGNRVTVKNPFVYLSTAGRRRKITLQPTCREIAEEETAGEMSLTHDPPHKLIV